MAVSEVSAFEEAGDDEEMKSHEAASETTSSPAIQADELAKARAEILALRKELTEKYCPLAIDMAAVRNYFQKYRAIINNEE